MIEFYVSGQTLKFFTPVVAADTLNYLTAKVHFTDDEWHGYSKWLHFRQDEELGAITYDLQLNEDDEITAEQHLNLTMGEWEIYLTGTREDSRLTTVPAILTVKESGLIDAPLHELPMSVAEQVDFNAKQALLLARAVKDMADAGEFDGTSFSPLGHFNSAEELEALVAEPQPGDVYSVGVVPPYNIYVWDGVNLLWRNQGKLQGATGEKGDPGATFFPIVDSNGLISWTNDGGYDNPKSQNIRGPKGDKGDAGADGKSPYDIAQEHGYTGTEETLNNAIKDFPSHHARHLPDGADPIVVKTGNIENEAVTDEKIAPASVTRAKLAQNALYSPIVTLSAAETVLGTEHIGATLRDNSNFPTNNITINANASIPVGSVVAVLFAFTQNVTITFGSGTKVYHLDTTEAKKFGVEKRGMAALQKFASSGGADYWYVSGNVEVIE